MITELTFNYFPRLHTAISEWLACMLFILPEKKRWGKLPAAALCLLMLPLLIISNLRGEMTRGWTFFLWSGIPMGLMWLMVWGTCRISKRTALYMWAFAFIFSEMAASLEWQFSFLYIKDGVFTAQWQVFLFMLAVYVLVYGAAALLMHHGRQKALESGLRMQISRQEAISGAMISIGAWLVSNFTFGLQETALAESLGDGMLYVRTLVDAGGIILLRAHELQRHEVAVVYELHATQALFNRQYEQYQQFNANNEALHRVYHDLKHQIRYLEGETDAERRARALQEMKETIRRHEARITTGNSVLDTLLTSKNLICADEQISMTCFADAQHLEFMNTMDICAILGNSLDNAIEYERTVADPQARLIRVLVRKEGEFLLIRVENYCDAQLVFRDGLPVTTKADQEMHGYGLKSIRTAAEKYNGVLEAKLEEDWFSLTVLIPLEHNR